MGFVGSVILNNTKGIECDKFGSYSFTKKPFCENVSVDQFYIGGLGGDFFDKIKAYELISFNFIDHDIELQFKKCNRLY